MEKRSSSTVLLWLLQLTLVRVACAHTPKVIKRIDTHCHYIPPFYAQLLRANNITAGGLPIPAWNVTRHLETMDLLNISLSVAAVSTPGAVIMDGYPIEESRKLARRLNEYGYNLSVQYPTRFRFFATLTLPDVEGSIAEAIYALETLNAAGVVILASSSGELLGSPLFAPLYAELDKRNVTVFVHPSQSPCRETEIFSANSAGIPAYAIDFLLDTSRAALNLVARNVTREYPNIKFLFAHSGGFLPFAAARIIGGIRLLTNASEAAVVSELETFYVDTALSGTKYALPSTLALLDITHLTFGSDFPFVPASGYLPNTANFDQYVTQKLPRTAFKQINLKTAAHLFSHILTPDVLGSIGS
ncbi:hypothetical protein Mapa_010425 [Marchantia paleacea]|nr:hypothetical protein Mapa_010425 [Marchantia paleacea]